MRRGLLTRNVALVARSPRLKAIPKTEAQSWTDEQLRQFLRTAAGHRLLPAAVAHRDDRDAPQRGPRTQVGRHRLQQAPARPQPRARRRRLRRAPDPRQDPQRASQHRPRHHHPRRARRVAGVPARRVRRRRDRADDGWVFTDGDGQPDPPPRRLPGVRADRPPRRRPGHPPPRPAPHPRHPAHQGRRAGQGRQRTARPRQHRLHHRDLPARPARHAGRRRPHLPAPRHTRSTGRRPTRWNAGGTAGGTPPEPGRTPPTTTKAQVADLGLHHQLVAGAGFEPATFGL